MTSENQNLSEALALLGVSHKPSKIEGKRDWFTASGDFIGSFDAFEGWAKLRASVSEAASSAAS